MPPGDRTQNTKEENDMKERKGTQLSALLIAMLLIGMVFVPAVSANAENKKNLLDISHFSVMRWHITERCHGGMTYFILSNCPSLSFMRLFDMSLHALSTIELNFGSCLVLFLFWQSR